MHISIQQKYNSDGGNYKKITEKREEDEKRDK